MKIPMQLSERLFEINTGDDLDSWLREVEKQVGGVLWTPLGGRDNNSHTVEVATDSALALVERPTNCIDAMLELMAETLGQTADTPHLAARKWFSIPADGLSAMSEDARRALADKIRVTMHESGDADRPTISIQDHGIGQHPDDFSATLLSIDGSTKLSKRHLMGVYNAGGSASYKFASRTIIVSRKAPTLLNDRTDEIGISIVKYVEPSNQKIGHYVSLAARDGSILRLDIPAMPNWPHGTYIKLLDYHLKGYAGRADLPTNSLWQLFHSALPDPSLPIRTIENRVERFSKPLGGKPSKRVINGLLHLLRNKGVSEHFDSRELNFGDDIGTVTLHYSVLAESTGVEAYTRADQGLTITLNGQRQITRERRWFQTELELHFLFKRLVVVVDGTGLTTAARRQVFTSTREAGVNSPTTATILQRVVNELREDDTLYELEENARQKTKEHATKSVGDKVKKQLSAHIGAYLNGLFPGNRGGTQEGQKKTKTTGRKRRRVPRVDPDDSMLPDIPDQLSIDTNPLLIEPDGTAPLRLSINAKNGFLPSYASGLSIVFGGSLNGKAAVVSTGRLLGGKARLTVRATPDAPLGMHPLKVALVIPELGVLLTADGQVEVKESEEEEEENDKSGGDFNIEINWLGRESFERMGWDVESVGTCQIYRDDPKDTRAITRVEWFLNEAFVAFEKVRDTKDMTERVLQTFQQNYALPVCFALFRQHLDRETLVDEEGQRIPVNDQYIKLEMARVARAVLMAMEPEMQIVGMVDG
jgi:hypothetical protein